MDDKIKAVVDSEEFQEQLLDMKAKIKFALISASESMDEENCNMIATMNKRMFDAHIRAGFESSQAIILTAESKIGGK